MFPILELESKGCFILQKSSACMKNKIQQKENRKEELIKIILRTEKNVVKRRIAQIVYGTIMKNLLITYDYL